MSDQPDVVAAVAERGFFGGGDPYQAAPNTLHVPTLANSTAFVTGDGVLLVDCGVWLTGPHIRDAVRNYTDAPMNTIVYTHGHLDHCMGAGSWVEDEPRIVAHELVNDRHDRYRVFGRMNEHINNVQFGFTDVEWPYHYYRPTQTYTESLTLRLGGERFELRHGKGETDDATWVWAPDRGVLCTGDFWISCVPNCGNPQKVQRYPEEWVVALRAMRELGAEVLLPGHGPAISGARDVDAALTEVIDYMGSIIDQTIDLLNQGLPHDEIVARVEIPSSDEEYLQPSYDRPEFIVRNLIRKYGGWWDGHPANLLGAPERERAVEIATLAGGSSVLVRRADELAATDMPLACQLAEWALLAEPDDADAAACVQRLFRERAGAEESLMGRGICMHAVRQAKRVSGGT